MEIRVKKRQGTQESETKRNERNYFNGMLMFSFWHAVLTWIKVSCMFLYNKTDTSYGSKI